MKKRKFADGGETTEMMPSVKPEGGRFDEDTYARARRFIESGGKKEETKTAVKRARKVEEAPASEAKATMRALDREAPASRADNGLRVDSTIERAAKMVKDKATEKEARRVNRAKNALGMLPVENEELKEDIRVGRLRNALGMSAPSRFSSGTVGVEKFKHGGVTKKYASGGSVSSASRRADGIATKGKTKCRIV